jgi:protoporphyrinogen/coproporphyrinogen III oxidase
MKDLIIVGGGISGLAAAFTAAQLGLKFELLESREVAGGNIRTEIRDGYLLERGPVSFLASSENIHGLAERLQATGRVTQALARSAARYIYRNGEAHKLFTGPGSFITSRLLGWRGKLALMTEPLRTARGSENDTAREFFVRRFGEEAASYLAGPFVSGVYAGDVNSLSAPAAFPLFWGFEQKHGGMIRGMIPHMKKKKWIAEQTGQALPAKGLYSFDNGLGTLAGLITEKLGVTVTCSFPVKKIEKIPEGFAVHGDSGSRQARSVILAVPAFEAARMLETELPEAAGGLRDIQYQPVAVVHLAFEGKEDEWPEGFGVLIPREEGVRTLGVLYPSSMFNGRAPQGQRLFTCYIGGAFDPQAVELPERELIDIAARDVAQVVGVKGSPVFGTVIRHSQAIPQYTLGHTARVRLLDKTMQETPGLYFASNFMRGVGLNDAAGTGIRAALAAGARHYSSKRTIQQYKVAMV